jgi:hypothetical protein
LPLDTQSYFSTKLTDMGELDSRLAGIWTPEGQLSSVPVGLTEQFTEHAGNYAAKDTASQAYFRRLIVRALALSGAQIGRTPRILDIGTGAGDNSFFPCLDLFENAEIVATDLSPNLLVLLRREVDRRRVADSVTVACVDEPFEFGHSILTLVFERIMTEASLRTGGLDPMVLRFMHLFPRMHDAGLAATSLLRFSVKLTTSGFSRKAISMRPVKPRDLSRSRLSRYMTQTIRSLLAPWAPTFNFRAFRHGRRRSLHRLTPHSRKRETR